MSGLEKLNQDIGILIVSIEVNEKEIQCLTRELEDDRLSDDAAIDIQTEIDHLQHENNECYKDIAILEELIRKFETELEEDESDEKYDGWDEVFTGGDY